MLLEQALAELCIEDVNMEESIEDVAMEEHPELCKENVDIEENPELCIEDACIEENEDPVELDDELLPSSSFSVHAGVPFLWEESPGKPKKNFKNDPNSLSDPPHIQAAAAAASVPFKWEEKPGMPKVLSNQVSNLALTLPPHRQTFPLSHLAATTNSAKGQPSRFKGIFHTRFIEFIKPSPLPKHTEKPQTNEAQELVLSPCRGSDADDEMFELDLSAFAFNGVKEPHSSRREAVSESLASKFSELKSSSRGGRSSDSAPALLANCLLTMMEMSQAVPVEDSSNHNMALPSFVSVDGSKDGEGADIVDNHKTHHMNSSEYRLECQRFDSIQPASPLGGGTSPNGETSPIVVWNESDSLNHIRWRERKLISSDEVTRASPIDIPCLELGIVSEEKSQMKVDDMNQYDSCSSPMGSFAFVAEGTSGSSTPLPSDVETSASSVQGRNSNSGLDTVTPRTGPESGTSSESNDCFAKDIGPPGNDIGSSSESNDCFAKDIGPPDNDSGSSSERNDCFPKDIEHPGNDSGSSSESNTCFAKTIDHPVIDLSHFQQGSSPAAGTEETVPPVFGANFRKHSRKLSFSARKLALCMEMKMTRIRCCSPSPAHTVHCCGGKWLKHENF